MPNMVMADADMEATLARWREQRVFRKRAEMAEEQTKNDVLLRLSATGCTKIDCGDRAMNVTAYRTKNGLWALRTPTSWRDDA